ncbi:hypothetical protein [Cupriavidus pauculus]|uniref:hypothetical protein n=1 Tax=Cupriavidus pauculus TaxID=82633 RepID=UPI001EE31E03|nr:hypothetical protein [Cupriavidus pauculus]GJG97720.1 hypothetical protein CBA19C6_24545 [Cupriavidus pauculus]
MSITAIRGEQTLARRGFTRPLREGQTIGIPAFESVDLHLTGGIFCPSECILCLADGHGVPPIELPALATGGTSAKVQQLRALISGTVFQNPQEAWSANVMATTLQTTPNKIRTALFTQGAAFTQLCRTQRLMRALFDSFLFDLSVADLRQRVGWGDGKDLEASFHDWFGVSLDTVARLRADVL